MAAPVTLDAALRLWDRYKRLKARANAALQQHTTQTGYLNDLDWNRAQLDWAKFTARFLEALELLEEEYGDNDDPEDGRTT